MSDHIGRRDLLIGGGAAFLATEATVADTADSRGWTEIENANTKLFREFQDSFDMPTLDIDKVMTRFLVRDASVRWFDDEPRAVSMGRRNSGRESHEAIGPRQG